MPQVPTYNVPPGYGGIRTSPVNNPNFVPPPGVAPPPSPLSPPDGFWGPDGPPQPPPGYWDPGVYDPIAQQPSPTNPTGTPGMQGPVFVPNGESADRDYGTFRTISQEGGPEFRPSNTAELLRKAAARRLGIE